MDDTREGVEIRAQRHPVASTFNPASLLRASQRSLRPPRLNYGHVQKVWAWFGDTGVDHELRMPLCTTILQFPRGLRGFFDAKTFTGDRNRDDIAKLSTAPIQYVMPALSRHLVGAVWMASMAASYGSTDPADRT